MGIFGRLFGRRLSKLVTCIVTREGDLWSVTWASDGFTPREFAGDDLVATIDRATAEVAALYVDRPSASEAELQFAIYPWRGEPGSVILDIEGGTEGFKAHDIAGGGTIVHGDSLDALVRDAERVLADPGVAMFRWIRSILSVLRD